MKLWLMKYNLTERPVGQRLETIMGQFPQNPSKKSTRHDLLFDPSANHCILRGWKDTTHNVQSPQIPWSAHCLPERNWAVVVLSSPDYSAIHNFEKELLKGSKRRYEHNQVCITVKARFLELQHCNWTSLKTDICAVVVVQENAARFILDHYPVKESAQLL